MERLEPKMSITETGRIIWEHFLVDHDPELYFRGKKITDIDFNSLFLKQPYQSNYITDSLTKFFDDYLGPAIHNRFTSEFNLAPSYVKTFTAEAWGELQEDGYYYITIPVEEHGLEPNDSDTDTDYDQINVSAEMHILTESGQFTVVPQVEVALDNTVRVYTDDNTIAGFVIVRLNDKAYTVAAAIVDASQIQGLARVAISAQYNDLLGIDGPGGPNTRITNTENMIDDIINGDITVHRSEFSAEAEYADYTTGVLLEGTIQGIPVSNIFEEGSSKVKHATLADHATTTDSATTAQYASSDTSKGTIEQRLTNLGFKSGSTTTGEFTWSSTAQTYFDTTRSYVNGYRQGNYVILEIYLKPISSNSYWANIFSRYTNLIQWNSEENYKIFSPKNNQEIKFNILGTFEGSVYVLGGIRQGSWEMGTDGIVSSQGVTIAGFGATDAIRYSVNVVDYFEFNKIQVGYEANPL